jgi:hypothetical protein
MPLGDPLPTQAQREGLAKLASDAFVEIRLLCWAERSAQAAALADAFHNILREMHGWGRFSWASFRGTLEEYQRRYARLAQYNYADTLDEIRGAP